MNHVRKSKLMYPKQWEEKHGVWDEKTRTYILPSGTVKQGRRPMFIPNKAIQVCNAGDWPDHLPSSFGDWLKANGDSIDIGGNEIPSRVQANHDRYGNERHPFA